MAAFINFILEGFSTASNFWWVFIGAGIVLGAIRFILVISNSG